MIASIKHRSRTLKVDLSRPLDISIPVQTGEKGVRAWYRDHARVAPYRRGDFIGSVAQGAPVNFNDIHFNPHAHVTHTECVGHITKEVHSVNKVLTSFFFLAELITIAPEKQGADFVVSKKQLQYALGNKVREAVVIRTLPNTKEKRRRDYSNSNPTYVLEEAAVFLRTKGIAHLLIDLPSVDKEKDEGALLAHRAFWDVDGTVRRAATITELVYVGNTIEDGTYLLNLQLGPFENDAAPSRPVLYKML